MSNKKSRSHQFFRQIEKQIGRFEIQKIDPNRKYSDDINVISTKSQAILISNFSRNNKLPINILNVGIQETSAGILLQHTDIRNIFKDIDNYTTLDIDSSIQRDNHIHADICNCPEIQDQSYDLVICNNVLEHVYEPWNAVSELVRITKKNGVLAMMAPFAFRYHPFPVDLYRFTPQGLEYLVARNTKYATLLKGYDLDFRRKDGRGGGEKTQWRDTPPVDNLGGWLEHWMSNFTCQIL